MRLVVAMQNHNGVSEWVLRVPKLFQMIQLRLIMVILPNLSHVYQAGQLLRQDPAVEAGLLLGGEGVALPAQLVDFPGNVQNAPLRRALKDHVFQ